MNREFAERERDVSLCDLLDRVLYKGVVVSGEVLITVADVELIYLGLQLVLTSVDTGRRLFEPTIVVEEVAYDGQG